MLDEQLEVPEEGVGGTGTERVEASSAPSLPSQHNEPAPVNKIGYASRDTFMFTDVSDG